MPRLERLVLFRDSLHALQMTAAFDVRFAELGATRAVASAVLGVDLGALVGKARIDITKAAEALGGDSPVSEPELRHLFDDLDSGAVAPSAAIQRLAAYAATITSTLTRSVGVLVSKSRDAGIAVRLESLRTSVELADASAPQGIDLSDLWFPAPGARSSATSALIRLGAETAIYEAGSRRLQELGVSSVLTKLHALRGSIASRRFDAAVTHALQGHAGSQPVSAAAVASVVATFRDYLVRDELVDGLVASSLRAVDLEARHLADQARAEFIACTAAALLLALVCVGVAVRLSRSISRPIKDLAAYAHCINEGQLDTEPATPGRHAPRETRLALSVFGELVDNLRLVDAKANALADCAFDDPVLAMPLPGRLGRSLDSSVAVLSASIVDRDLLQTHLAHQATHDSLTGLLNRPGAMVGIQAAMSRSARSGVATALLFIDLNEFKTVNDSHGHEMGDDLLKQVASRISTGLRQGDFVARLGGDEFIVVTEGVTDVGQSVDLARRIIDLVEEPFDLGTHHTAVGCAIGIALTLDGPEDPSELLGRADAAMYRAKRHNTSAFELFDADLQSQMLARADIESALSEALADVNGGGLSLSYQPILHAASGGLAGIEALIRWDRPGHGPLAPDDFIPIAEASSLIISVDCWVIDQVTRQLAAWSTDPDLAHVSAAINISGRHLLSGQLPGHLRAALERSGVDPARVHIEITETVVLGDLITAATELQAVRALGIRVAIDDFGTGYTSLAHLQQLPIDSIKIDRSFVNQVAMRRGLALVQMITALGHAIDVTVVGEGVETPGEMSALQNMGADQVQGYLLSRPLTPAALTAWVRAHAAHEVLAG